jgi:hypothetical protein
VAVGDEEKAVSKVEEALQGDLDRWGPDLGDSALAAAALDVASRLGPDISGASASLLHGQLRQYLGDLRALAPAAEETDGIDEIAEQRRRRRAAGEG